MDQRDPRTGKEHREFFNIDLSSGWETIAPGIEAKTLAGSLDVFDRGIAEHLAAGADADFAQFDGGFNDGFGKFWARRGELIHDDGSF